MFASDSEEDMVVDDSVGVGGDKEKASDKMCVENYDQESGEDDFDIAGNNSGNEYDENESENDESDMEGDSDKSAEI